MSEHSEGRAPMSGLQRAARGAQESLVTSEAAAVTAEYDFAQLLELVQCALEGDQLEQPVESRAHLAARIRMLRRTFVRDLQTASEEEELRDGLRVLHAIDQVEEFLERDPAHRFVRHLIGPDPLASIVALAHDMRSPLTSILFLVDTLRTGQTGAVSAVRERQLGLVYSAAFGLSSMVNDVIELARGGDRVREPQPVPLSLSEMMVSVQRIVQPIAEEKGLEIRLEFSDGDARLGYSMALNRVLLNLLTNALKFTHSGTVTLGARDLTRSLVEFFIQDTGPGIPAEVMPGLFDAFRPLPERNSHGGGFVFSSAGLGLAICQTLVRSMSGELHVDSSPEQGTRFYFQVDLPPAPRISVPQNWIDDWPQVRKA